MFYSLSCNKEKVVIGVLSGIALQLYFTYFVLIENCYLFSEVRLKDSPKALKQKT